MKNLKRSNSCTEGFLFPYSYNSDGKSIKFMLQLPEGDAYLINGDHLLKQMRRYQFQQVMVCGNFLSDIKFQKVINAQRIYRSLEPIQEERYINEQTDTIQNIVA